MSIQPSEPHSPAAPDLQTPQSRDPSFYLMALVGVAVAGYGLLMIIQSKAQTRLGWLLLALGVSFIPLTITVVLGGVGLIGWAAWFGIMHARYPLDYLYVLIAAAVGVTAISEHIRRRKRLGPPAA